jgi:hypothetical protein
MRPRGSFTFSTHLLRTNLPPFVDDFHPKMKVFLNWNTFVSTLARSPCLYSDGPPNCFVLDGFRSGFDFFFKVCGHIIRSHIPPLVSCLLSTSQHLTLEKQFKSICPIAINEVTYCLVNLWLFNSGTLSQSILVLISLV